MFYWVYIFCRHLDLNHEFLKQVRESPRKVITVIVGRCSLKNKGTVTASKSISATEKVEEDKVKSIDRDILKREYEKK